MFARARNDDLVGSQDASQERQDVGVEDGLKSRAIEAQRILRGRKVRTCHGRREWALECVMPSAWDHSVINSPRITDTVFDEVSMEMSSELVFFRCQHEDRNIDVRQGRLGREPAAGRCEKDERADSMIGQHRNGYGTLTRRRLERSRHWPATRDSERCIAAHGMADENDSVA